MSGDAVPLDSTVEIVTPENIAFGYRLAGPFYRLNAYLIDLVLRGALLIGFSILVSVIAGLTGYAWLSLIAIFWFLLEWFYGGVFETYMNGQTPGKRLVGIRVLTTDGQPINGLQAVLRNVLRAADSMPWFSLELLGGPSVQAMPTFAIGLFTMVLNRRFQRLGDIVCGTMVVVEERNWYAGAIQTEDQRVIQLATRLPADFEVTRAGARALATYVERRRVFSQARRTEIARQLADAYITRFGLPADTSPDLLLCAVYYRMFVNRTGGDVEHIPGPATLLPPTGEEVLAATLVDEGAPRQ